MDQILEDNRQVRFNNSESAKKEHSPERLMFTSPQQSSENDEEIFENQDALVNFSTIFNSFQLE